MMIVNDPFLTFLVAIFIGIKLFQLKKEGKFKKVKPKSEYKIREEDIEKLIKRYKKIIKPKV